MWETTPEQGKWEALRTQKQPSQQWKEARREQSDHREGPPQMGDFLKANLLSSS